jgi:hypothetical protein
LITLWLLVVAVVAVFGLLVVVVVVPGDTENLAVRL